MSTLFIALQCSQCSTMQVKQKKKSSNKWNCAICNQNQSIRKVFAQGFIAKDVRNFVQDFNITFNSFDHAGTLDPPLERNDGDVTRGKKRYDWSVYLDREDHHTLNQEQQQQQHRHRDDFEPLVVTELHKGMVKRRKAVEDSSSGSDKHFKKPVFHNPQEEPVMGQQRVTSLTEINPKRNNYATPDNQRTQKSKPTSTRAASKWNNYLTEDNENLDLRWNKSSIMEDHSGLCNNSILEAITSDRVEDDIHPDFM